LVGPSHVATLPALRSMHLSGYYMLAPWSDVCITVRMLLQLGSVLKVMLARDVLVGLMKKFGDKFDRVPT
jgi:hypothetical protein